MPDTQTNYERTKELTDRLEAGMKDLFQSDKYKNFLITRATARTLLARLIGMCR